MLVSIYIVAPKIDLLSVTSDPETAEIHSIVLIHTIGGHYIATIIVATCLVSD